jgi:hypothetical protein
MWVFLVSNAESLTDFTLYFGHRFNVNCGFNLGMLFVINLIIFCLICLFFLG